MFIYLGYVGLSSSIGFNACSLCFATAEAAVFSFAYLAIRTVHSLELVLCITFLAVTRVCTARRLCRLKEPANGTLGWAKSRGL